MNKNEVLEESAVGSNWRHNGLSSLHFKEISVSRPSLATSGNKTSSSSHCIIVKVDVLENAHWSDLVCKVDDVQHDQTLADLKARYADLQRAHSGRGDEPGRKKACRHTL